jgi:Carboxypeptidase regulatory-like domain
MNTTIWATCSSGETGWAGRRLLVSTLAVILLTAGGCGNGDGGADGNSPATGTPPTGNPPAGSPAGERGKVLVSVIDPLGEPAAGARVTAYALDAGGTFENVTDSTGHTEFNMPPGRVGVSASGPDYGGGVAETTLTASTPVELIIRTAPALQWPPAGGVGGAWVPEGSVSADGRTLEVMIDILNVTGANSTDGWGDDVRIEACTPDPANTVTARADCVIGPDGFDAAYAGVGSDEAVEYFWSSNAGLSFGSFQAVLLVEQSSDFATGDPADRRLFAAKYFLSQATDRGAGLHGALFGAFAADQTSSGRLSALPQKPVTLFPVENPEFVTNGRGYSSTVDSLDVLEGGVPALLPAIDRAVDFLAQNAWAGDRAIVVITSGGDETCGTQAECLRQLEAVAAKSNANRVRIVTVGLATATSGVDHGMLGLLSQASTQGGATFWLTHPNQMAVAMVDAYSFLGGYKPFVRARFRIESPTAGAFASGRTVLGRVKFLVCPWDCEYVSVPFAAKIP